MRRTSREAVDFVANPFVALADCLVVLLLILILAVVHSTITNRDNVQRVAISQLQDQLLAELGDSAQVNTTQANAAIASDPLLRSAFKTKRIVPSFRDGDLQRFWFDGTFFFQKGSAQLTAQGIPLLARFRQVLSAHQGDRQKRGNGLFKYILVEGHADSLEGTPARVQALAAMRAANAETLLRNGDRSDGISPLLIRAYGRADLDPAPVNFYEGEFRKKLEKLAPEKLAAYNKRIEIVVVYSGNRAYDYIKHHASSTP